MEESLRAIEASKESATDVASALQIRLQLLAQEAVQFREQREWEFARAGSVQVQLSLPIPTFEQYRHSCIN